MRLLRNEQRKIKGRESGTFKERISCADEYSTGVAYSWFREVIQNSYDAGAKNISIDVTVRDDGSYIVKAQDDGKGMSEKVFTDIFFALGGTDKESGGFAGGFGKAKELILLPWKRWRVTTSDGRKTLVADSPKGWLEYDLKEVNGTGGLKSRTGTMVSIETWSNEEYYSARRYPETYQFKVEYALRFLNFCKLPGVTITLSTNGSTNFSGQPNFGASRARVVVYDKPPEDSSREEVGKIYVAENQSGISRFFTRSRGLLLWQEDPVNTGKKGFDVIFDIILPKSVPVETILNSSRSAISNQYVRSTVRSFFNGMIRDPIEQMRKSAPIRNYPFSGFGMARANVSERDLDKIMSLAKEYSSCGASVNVPSASEKEKIEQVVTTTVIKVADKSREDSGSNPSPISINVEAAKAVILDAILNETPETAARIVESFSFIPDFILHLDDVPDDYKPHQRFFPKTMTKEVRGLICAWTDICRIVLMRKACAEKFGVGFVFSSDAVAAFYNYSGRNYLLLNPYRKGDTLLDPENPDDVKDMFASAVHEITHFADGCHEHDLAFSSMLTINIGITSTLFPLALKVARSAAKVGSVKEADVSEHDVTSHREWEQEIFSGKMSPSERASSRKMIELARELALSGVSEKKVISLLPTNIRTEEVKGEIASICREYQSLKEKAKMPEGVAAILEKSKDMKIKSLTEEIEKLKLQKGAVNILSKSLRFNGSRRRGG